MVLANFLAFAIFCLFPCAPPRLLPESLGFKDTVRQENAESVWASGVNVNQFAAMPSLHFSYAFIIGCTLIYQSEILPSENDGQKEKKKMRLLSPVAATGAFVVGLCYPLLVLTVIVATANHYWLDAVVATLTVTLALLANKVLYVFLPAERKLCRVLRLRKPTPSTRGDRRVLQVDEEVCCAFV